MKKIYLILFSFIVLFVFIHKITAIGTTYIKNSNNPIYEGSNFGVWNETGIYQPSVIFENNQFKMWYASYNGSNFKIAYSTSTNGINWTNSGPILEEQGRTIHNPNILNDNEINKYILTFASSINGGTNSKIKIVQSDNEIDFINNVIQEIPPQHSWESGDMSAPFLWKENGIYYLFYAARNGTPWKLGIATSSNLINWNHCSNPLFEDIGDMSLIKNESTYFLFHHNSTGTIVMRTSSDPLSCTMTWSQPETVLAKDQPYDNQVLIAPSVLIKDGITYIYYSGFGTSTNKWTLNLATDQQLSGTTPTPTQIPSTPTPTPLPKIILVPGIFGSWNRNAILKKQTVLQSAWKLTPFFHEIDGLIKSLQNVGYTINDNLFTFTYDWRQPIATSSNELSEYIASHFSETDTIKLYGHSLGGVVARTYMQQSNNPHVTKLITAGSPHTGTAWAYKPLSAGEIERNDTEFWLAEQSLLQLYRANPFQQNKDIINVSLPVLKDLLPITPYLKKSNNTFVPIASMNLQNDFLLSLSPTFSNLFPLLATLAGKDIPTLSGYKITERTLLDKLFGKYKDGRPISSLTASGDNMVTELSALQGTDKISFHNYYHGDLLNKKNAIKTTLDKLEIPYTDDDIDEEIQTTISPSLILFMQSPATMKVFFNGNAYTEEDGMLFIPNAQDGTYTLEITGNDLGQYSVTIGEIGSNSDYWTKLKGEITKTPPSSQTDSYSFSFNSVNPQPNLFDEKTLFKQLQGSLPNNPTTVQEKTFLNTLKLDLNSMSDVLDTKNYTIIKARLLKIHNGLVQLIQITNGERRGQYLNSLDLFEQYYNNVLSPLKPSPIPNIKALQSSVQKSFISKQKTLSALQDKGKNVQNEIALLFVISEKIEQAKKYATTNVNYSEILLLSSQKLLAL